MDDGGAWNGAIRIAAAGEGAVVRIAVMSDLHLENGAWPAPPLDADLLVLAGDIAHGTDGVRWAAEGYPGLPTVYVAGNHEHWGPDAESAIAALRRAAAATANVRLLERRAAEVVFGGRRLRVLGCTLWSDYRLFGEERAAEAMAAMAEQAPDYRNIRVDGRGLRPDDIVGWHRAALAWLDGALAADTATATLVVTHHAPSPASLTERQRGRIAAAGAASDLESLIRRNQPSLWVHGHTHKPADYRIGRTRIVNHPAGPFTGGPPPAVLTMALPL